MKTIILMVSLIILIGGNCFGQQLFQDASGKSKYFFANNPYGWLTYNTSDKSASLGYVHNSSRPVGYDHNKEKSKYNYIYGGDLKVNVKDGLGNIISGGNFKPGITLAGTFGAFSDVFLNKGDYINLFVRPTISFTEYDYIPKNTNKLIKDKLFEYGFLFNFNFQFNEEKVISKKDGKNVTDPNKRHYYFVGLQTGINQINNYNDLDDVTLTTVLYSDTSGSVLSSKAAKSGSLIRNTAMPLNIDLGVTPRIFNHNYFGFNTYFRSNLFVSKSPTNVGLGIYLADEKKPSNIAGGIAWQFNDVFDVLKKAGSTFERSSLFLYVGYSIGGK
jgi:hypothetical protein